MNLRLRIDWSDLDLLGHVNNVAYFRFIQAARINFWQACGLSPLFNESEVGPILLSTQCQFRVPLFYPGDIVVETRIEFIKNTSYGMHHRIRNSNGEIAAEAHDILVNYNFKTGAKIPMDGTFRSLLEKLGIEN